MLILKKELWDKDKILKIISDDNWSKPDTDILLNCALAEIKNLIIESTKNTIKTILIIDVTKGTVPSLFYLGKIISYLIEIKSLIREGVQFTLLYDKNNTAKYWLDIVMSMYTPERPLFCVNSKEKILQYVNDREKVDFNYK